ncbi:hypothetical protein C8F04DRAFT_1184060 [Mycena alexandri]|uniref:Uncharacterized protein n=1 Tax=Mycena alexandri TaxID=1745969 RepID=A0AAD6X3L5_9AGAR|nr:hypothetical protein C8F04DRAFT_1184060 [Mycena alexandri]
MAEKLGAGWIHSSIRAEGNDIEGKKMVMRWSNSGVHYYARRYTQSERRELEKVGQSGGNKLANGAQILRGRASLITDWDAARAGIRGMGKKMVRLGEQTRSGANGEGARKRGGVAARRSRMLPAENSPRAKETGQSDVVEKKWREVARQNGSQKGRSQLPTTFENRSWEEERERDRGGAWINRSDFLPSSHHHHQQQGGTIFPEPPPTSRNKCNGFGTKVHASATPTGRRWKGASDDASGVVIPLEDQYFLPRECILRGASATPVVVVIGTPRKYSRRLPYDLHATPTPLCPKFHHSVVAPPPPATPRAAPPTARRLESQTWKAINWVLLNNRPMGTVTLTLLGCHLIPTTNVMSIPIDLSHGNTNFKSVRQPSPLLAPLQFLHASSTLGFLGPSHRSVFSHARHIHTRIVPSKPTEEYSGKNDREKKKDVVRIARTRPRFERGAPEYIERGSGRYYTEISMAGKFNRRSEARSPEVE